MEKLVLASKSERRKEILEKVNINFVVHQANIPEKIKKEEHVTKTVMDIAYQKAIKVFSERKDKLKILSADTVVYFDNEIIGKPVNRQDAFNTLSKLSGKVHEVYTGFCIMTNSEDYILDYEKTEVKFREIDNILIDFYLNNEKYSDKAGAYAIQGMAALFVEKINGCFFNVMGLPISKIFSILST